MFYSYKDNSVKFIGRWSEFNDTMTSATPGSVIKIAFKGKWATLHFNTIWNSHPYPHLWLSIDGGCRFEAPVNPFLRVEANSDGDHVLTVTFKSAVEMHQRWHHPLIGKISFIGYEADGCAVVPEDNRKTIELVGDSITEGVLVEDREWDKNEGMFNRPYQDDSTATYAYLTAQKLDLIPLHMGYGAVGATKGGCGSVPKASEAYPYCFDGHPVTYRSPDYILINHGANDRGATAEKYTEEYCRLLDVIRKINPSSQIIALSAFCGAFPVELEATIEKYNEEHGCNIIFINSTGWVPLEPLHPLRDGHKIIAEKLTPILKEKLGL